MDIFNGKFVNAEKFTHDFAKESHITIFMFTENMIFYADFLVIFLCDR